MRRLLVGLILLLLVACSGGNVRQALPALPADSSRTRSGDDLHALVEPEAIQYKVIHTFGGDINGAADGATPDGDLVSLNGELYGTTSSGGYLGDGSIFKISPTGSVNVLHAFEFTDGYSPMAGMIVVNNTLYGTTSGGGSGYVGTVFTSSLSGDEKVLGSFSGRNGSSPWSVLADVNGELYGTTLNGGKYGYGNIFKASLSGGGATSIYDFTGGTDGGFPLAGLVNVNGTLYGTTEGGGTDNIGVVFKVSTTGSEHVVYSFRNNESDGGGPMSALIIVNGILYGTTSAGGSSAEAGTVYSVTTSGSEHVIYAFKGGLDGSAPAARLVAVGTTALYGTTTLGGGSGCGGSGCGTVFGVSLSSRTETILHRFAGGKDGADPQAGLTYLNELLYGPTAEGGNGANGLGDGTAFSVTP